jgi:FkbM family methyltransferase
MKTLTVEQNDQRGSTVNYGDVFGWLDGPNGMAQIYSICSQDNPDVEEVFQLTLRLHLLNRLRTVEWSEITKFDELQILQRFPYPAADTHTLVDVGAFIGYSCKPFAEKGWRVVAFEPEPENYKALCNTLRGFSTVTAIPKAVSCSAQETVPFYVSSQHWAIHSLRPFHPTHQPTVTVDTVRLDETLVELGIEHVSVLKIDIEGADFLALRSFDFERYHPEVVMCEYMDERSEEYFGYNHHDMVSYLADFGYTTLVSEWAPIIEYARKGVPTTHRFLQCVPYPLDRNPAWGNLIAVPIERFTPLLRTLLDYLKKVGGESRHIGKTKEKGISRT